MPSRIWVEASSRVFSSSVEAEMPFSAVCIWVRAARTRAEPPVKAPELPFRVSMPACTCAMPSASALAPSSSCTEPLCSCSSIPVRSISPRSRFRFSRTPFRDTASMAKSVTSAVTVTSLSAPGSRM